MGKLVAPQPEFTNPRKCEHCGNKVPLRKVDRQIIFPSNDKMPVGLPEKILKSYLSALKVKTIDANAFGVLIGRTIELVCEDRRAVGNSLEKKLKNLAERGEIPARLADVANSLRQLRNIGAHPSIGELSENEVPILNNLCIALLEYVYSAPYLKMPL